MKLKRVRVQDGRYYYIQDLEARSPTTGKPKQKWLKLTRVSEGEAALHAALAALLAEDKPPQKNMPALIEEFKKAHLPALSPRVRREYERMFGVIAKCFVQFDADEVLPGDVLDFLNQIDKPIARKSYKARLSTLFAWMVLNNHIAASPTDKVRLPKTPTSKGLWTDERFWKLHDALPAIGQCFLMLCFLTRQRSEGIRLLQEFSIGQTHIHFKPSKTERSSGEEAEILISPDIRNALERARKLAKVKTLPGGTGYLIQTTGGTPFTATGLRSMFARACKAAGLPMLPPKSIRPYALKAMERAGYDLKEIQKSATHSNTTTTEGYLNQYRDRVSNAITPLPGREKLRGL